MIFVIIMLALELLKIFSILGCMYPLKINSSVIPAVIQVIIISKKFALKIFISSVIFPEADSSPTIIFIISLSEKATIIAEI